MARKLLKRFPQYNKKMFMNLEADDESWIQYFKLHPKISNHIWLTKIARRSCNAKRITSLKGYACHILSPKGLAIQVIIPKRTSMNARFYTKKFLENLSNSLIRLHGRTGWSAPVLCANSQGQVFSCQGPYYIR